MTREELIAENKAQKELITSLQHQLEQLQKLIFGSKSERFVSDIPDNQLNLFSDLTSEESKEETATEEITYTRKKKKHPGRNPFPSHLPVKEEIIEPEGDLSDMVRIGEEVSETLEYIPASLYIRRIIRPKYALKKGEGNIKIAPLPNKPIEKGIAGSSLLAWIIVSKFVDHLPFYRIRQQLKRDYDWDPPSSTINDWFVAVCTLLKPLYNHLQNKILNSGYIQVDESHIKVLDKDKARSTHRGYQWVYHGVKDGLILFHYRKGRGAHGPKEMLQSYEGWLQADGYSVYDKIAARQKIQIVGCHVHVRRKFYEAKDYDPDRGNYALGVYRQLYDIEEYCQTMTAEERQAYRNIHSRPVLEEFKKWLDKEAIAVLPQSPMGKAIRYAIRQWNKTIRILDNGNLEMDNNLIENKIRPLALGRKNYLFAGSHAAAQRIAIIYSFFATCKAQEINPYIWLKETLDKIPNHPVNRLDELLPRKLTKAEEIPKM